MKKKSVLILVAVVVVALMVVGSLIAYRDWRDAKPGEFAFCVNCCMDADWASGETGGSHANPKYPFHCKYIQSSEACRKFTGCGWANCPGSGPNKGKGDPDSAAYPLCGRHWGVIR